MAQLSANQFQQNLQSMATSADKSGERKANVADQLVTMSNAVQQQAKVVKTQQKIQDNAIKAIEESMLSFQ